MHLEDTYSKESQKKTGQGPRLVWNVQNPAGRFFIEPPSPAARAQKFFSEPPSGFFMSLPRPPPTACSAQKFFYRASFSVFFWDSFLGKGAALVMAWAWPGSPFLPETLVFARFYKAFTHLWVRVSIHGIWANAARGPGSFFIEPPSSFYLSLPPAQGPGPRPQKFFL